MVIQTTEFSPYTERILSLGLAQEQIERLGEIHQTIVKGYDNSLDSRIDVLFNTIPEEERLTVLENIQLIKEGVDQEGNISNWNEGRQVALRDCCQTLVKNFNFVDPKNGYELMKGTFEENLQGIAERQANPDNSDVIIDCKLPAIILHTLLKRESINSRIVIRYGTGGPSREPNFSAHPSVFIPVDTSTKIANIHSHKGLEGVLADFVALPNTSYKVLPIYEKLVDVNYGIPGADKNSRLVHYLDIYFFVGKMITQIRQNDKGNDRRREVKELMQELIPKKSYRQVQSKLEIYIDHLFNVPL
ncbi:MAG: hypothetical protein US52_C0043G0003 [candidate division WS6 bacterium GW2011_GWA2_37_6]|uniref:Uncharacterized protein n=1 Tax=candidate division WS6 bacterium GW2011_GWA2_37_6 TaxID=1619087 RepID=A0A0G0K2L8_9BACT|nr:MAG: hypothetical protein US52_C0043G0003 [candidate division WS6 bacterium GW2011_GWA2_37_6]